MKLAFYIGDHKDDAWTSWAGGAITRLVQKGPYSNIIHVEAIHEEHEDGTITIASSSLRDKGVRSTRVYLNPSNWMIVDVPSWDVGLSVALLENTRGVGYDIRGAIATAFLGAQDSNRWFCNEWVAHPYLFASGTFGPHQLMAIALSLGTLETAAFFAEREHLREVHQAKNKNSILRM